VPTNIFVFEGGRKAGIFRKPLYSYTHVFMETETFSTKG
jgi:hypothetical protein